MLCPICKVDLAVSERQGIEIDYCPQCRGVWLDRGELDKMIERSMGPVAPYRDTRSMPEPSTYREGYGRGDHDYHKGHGDYDDHHDGDQYKHGRRKRGGLLGELFDF